MCPKHVPVPPIRAPPAAGALTCELSHGAGRQRHDVLRGHRDDVDLPRGDHVVQAVDGLVRAASQHQPLHARLALVHGAHVGAQVVHAVEPAAAFVAQVRLLSWDDGSQGGKCGSFV